MPSTSVTVVPFCSGQTMLGLQVGVLAIELVVLGSSGREDDGKSVEDGTAGDAEELKG